MSRGEFIAGMLRENTGRHMLDSGGVGGRAWEQNQNRDFESEPPAWWDHVSLSFGPPLPTISTYHLFMESELDPLHGVTEEYNEFAFSEEWLREPHIDCMVEFAHRKGWGKMDVSGNTYNEEVLIDQDFQFHYWGDVGVVAIQSHNGADIRGGYASPRFFSAEWEDVVDLVSRAREVPVVCDGKEPEIPEPEPETLPGMERPERGEQHVYSLGVDIDAAELEVDTEAGIVKCPECEAKMEVGL